MEKKKVVIVGGGISGLGTAYFLNDLSKKEKFPLHIKVLESQNRLGGLIHSIKDQGLLMEEGPDAFITEKPWALALSKQLGLEDQFLETRIGFRRSYIYTNKKLIEVPKGLYLFTPVSMRALWRNPLLSWKAKIRMAFEPFVPRKKDDGDESVAHFIRRRLGQEVLERLGQPMLSGIYTADPEKLSLKATMPRFLEMEKKYGSLYRAMKQQSQARSASGPRYSLFMSFKGGLETLTDKMLECMPEVEILKNIYIEKVYQNQTWEVEAKKESPIQADAVCLAIGANRASSLIHEDEKDLSDLLGKIPYASVATLNLVFKREDISEKLDGFGFVVPSTEKTFLVGCTFSSVKFESRAKEDTVLLRAFIGEASGLLESNDDELVQSVTNELKSILKINADPIYSHMSRFPLGMPQYHVGHLDLIRDIDNKLDQLSGLFLTGNAYHGIGIPDCIHQAEISAQRIMDFLKGRDS